VLKLKILSEIDGLRAKQHAATEKLKEQEYNNDDV